MFLACQNWELHDARELQLCRMRSNFNEPLVVGYPSLPNTHTRPNKHLLAIICATSSSFRPNVRLQEWDWVVEQAAPVRMREASYIAPWRTKNTFMWVFTPACPQTDVVLISSSRLTSLLSQANPEAAAGQIVEPFALSLPKNLTVAAPNWGPLRTRTLQLAFSHSPSQQVHS